MAEKTQILAQKAYGTPPSFYTFLNKVLIFTVFLCVSLMSGCDNLTVEDGELKINKTVVRRGIYFKIPLAQPDYHWVFEDRASFLKDVNLRLDVYETKIMDVKDYSFSIIEKGKLSPDWEPIDDDDDEAKAANQIYFGFVHEKQMDFNNYNYVKVTLDVKQDLEGQGADNTGVLMKGKYISTGFFEIYDEEIYDVGTDEYVFLGKDTLKPNWFLKISSDNGWMKE